MINLNNNHPYQHIASLNPYFPCKRSSYQHVPNSKKQGNFHSEYFPDNGDTEQSVATAKNKQKPSNPIKRLRPKLSSKQSRSSTERTSNKFLSVEISKLTSQLQRKNKALIKITSHDKIKEAEVIELYRVIHFYEGKMKHLEDQIKRYEEALEKIGRECDEKSRHKSEVEEMVKIFESMRKENGELLGKIEEKDYLIGNLQQSNHKLEIKLNFLVSKQSYKRKANNDSIETSRSKIICLQGSWGSSNLKQKQSNYGNIQSKINKIETSLHFLKKQNQILQKEINIKDEKVSELQKQLVMFQAMSEDTLKKQKYVEEPKHGEKDQKQKKLQKMMGVRRTSLQKNQETMQRKSGNLFLNKKQNETTLKRKQSQKSRNSSQNSSKKSSLLNNFGLNSDPAEDQIKENDDMNESLKLGKSSQISSSSKQQSKISQNSNKSQESKHVSQISKNSQESKHKSQIQESKHVSQISKSSQESKHTSQIQESKHVSQISKNSQQSKHMSENSKNFQESKQISQISKNSQSSKQMSQNKKNFQESKGMSQISKNSEQSQGQNFSQISKQSNNVIFPNLDSQQQHGSQRVEDFIQKKKNQLNKEIFKKLKYQLLTEELSFEEFVKFLVDEDLEAEVLEESPYNLKSHEAEELTEWISQLVSECKERQYNVEQTVGKIIPKFKTLTLRMQNNMKIQIANQILNREQQLAQLQANGSEQRQSQIEQQFKDWGLSQQHIDTLCKNIYEETGEVVITNMLHIKQIADRWAAK